MIIEGYEFLERLDLMQALLGKCDHCVGPATDAILQDQKGLVHVTPIFSVIIQALVNNIDNVRKLTSKSQVR